jgi:integrase
MAMQLTMELDEADCFSDTAEVTSGRAAGFAAHVSALAMNVPNEGVSAFRLTGRELITRNECKRRLAMTSVTVSWLINDIRVLDLEKDDAGKEMVVWVFGTDRQSLLDRYVADRGVPRDPAAFEAYRSVLRGLDRGVAHRDEVILAARDFLIAEGIVANAHEIAGLIGGRMQLAGWVKNYKLASGQFVEMRTLTGSNYVPPTETFDDVLRRLNLGNHVPEGTLGDPRLRDPIFEPTGFQCRNLLLLKNEQLFRAVAMYLMVKMVDDVLPATVDRILQIAFRLDLVLRGVDLSDVRQVTERLDEYVADKSILTEDSDGVRATTVYLLYSMYETVGDWCDLLPAKERAYFRSFEVALPRRSSKFIKLLSGMDRDRLSARLTKRKGRSDRLVAGFDLSRFLVDVRFNMVRRMHEAFVEVRRELMAMTREKRDAKLPYDFWYVEHVPACLDEPAVDQLVRLRVTTRQQLMADLGFDADGKVVDHDMAQRTRGTRYYDEATEDDYLLEYIDTIGLEGAEPRPLWMVDRIRTCFFLNPAILTAEDATLRRAAMREMHMGTSHSQHAGLFLGWGGRDGNSVPYRAMSRQGRTFLPIENIYMMASMGRITVRITTTNGARPSELLQLMIDEERWGEVYDEVNRVDVTYFEAVPKMKDDWFVFFIDEDTRQAIEDLVDFLSERYYGGGNLPVIAPASCLYSKRLHGEPLPHAAYILSWNGVALDHVEFSICQRLMMHGFGDFLPYDTRHAFATMARAENMPADVLQKILHHERPSQTAMYSDPTAQEKAQHFTAFAGRRHHGADLIASGHALDGGNAAAFDRIGGLGRTPCGHCMNPHPCGDRTACVGCAYNRSNPAFRSEALRELEHAERRLRDAEDEGFARFAEQARSDVEDVQAILREMDLIELSRADNASHPDVRAGAPEPCDA